MLMRGALCSTCCGADRAAASRVLVEYKVRDLSSAEMGSSRTAEPPPSWPELLGQGQPRRRLSRGWWRNKLAETQTTIFNPRTHTAYVCRPLFTLAASVFREDKVEEEVHSPGWAEVRAAPQLAASHDIGLKNVGCRPGSRLIAPQQQQQLASPALLQAPTQPDSVCSQQPLYAEARDCWTA